MIKQESWRGKTEEEVKKMELKEFMELIPARQRRSLKRGFTEAQEALLRKINAGEKNIKTHCRDFIIIPSLLGQTIRIHNGKEFIPLIITGDMLGHCLGEFSLTRKSVKHSAAGIGATKSSRAISAR